MTLPPSSSSSRETFGRGRSIGTGTPASSSRSGLKGFARTRGESRRIIGVSGSTTSAGGLLGIGMFGCQLVGIFMPPGRSCGWRTLCRFLPPGTLILGTLADGSVRLTGTIGFHCGFSPPLTGIVTPGCCVCPMTGFHGTYHEPVVGFQTGMGCPVTGCPPITGCPGTGMVGCPPVTGN